MCMFSRKEKRLNVSLFVCKFACFNSESARKSIDSADTLSTLSIEGFLKKKILLLHPGFFSGWPIS